MALTTRRDLCVCADPVTTDERGDVTANTILAGLAFLMIFLTIQVAVGFHARSVVTSAAQDGVRAAQVENATNADAVAAANQILNGSSGLLEGQTVSAVRNGDQVTVRVTSNFSSLIPGLNGPVTATASGPVERFRSQAER